MVDTSFLVRCVRADVELTASSVKFASLRSAACATRKVSATADLKVDAFFHAARPAQSIAQDLESGFIVFMDPGTANGADNDI